MKKIELHDMVNAEVRNRLSKTYTHLVYLSVTTHMSLHVDILIDRNTTTLKCAMGVKRGWLSWGWGGRVTSQIKSVNKSAVLRGLRNE